MVLVSRLILLGCSLGGGGEALGGEVGSGGGELLRDASCVLARRVDGSVNLGLRKANISTVLEFT